MASFDETRIQPRPGGMLLDAYEILEELGGGGMAEVYKVRHTLLEEIRAIKVLRPEFADDSRISELFVREARALTRVQHPAVVRCYEFLPDKRLQGWCLVMEVVEGVALSERVERGPLSIEQGAVLFERIAQGLAAAHEKGVIHRDISPDNIILADDLPDKAKLIDFGIVKLQDPTMETVIGSDFAGKIAYASPEQFGSFGGQVDARSDYYSLGLVMAEVVLGRRVPMGRTTVDAIHARKSVPKLPDEFPESFRTPIEALLQPNPASRPQSAEELFALLPRPSAPSRRVASSEAVVGVRRPEPTTTGRKRALALSVAILTAVVAGTWLGWTVYRDDVIEREQTQRIAEYENLARQHRVNGRLDESLAAIEAGLKLAPANVELLALRTTVESEVAKERRRETEEERRQVELSALLARAEQHMQAGLFTEPVGGNATETFRQVLALDPGNPTAEAGLGQIAAQYRRLAEQSRATGAFRESLTLIDAGLGVVPDHTGLAALRSAVQTEMIDARRQASETERLQKEISDWLARSDRQMRAYRLTEPPGDNAYESYQKVLALDPTNKEAKAGLARIPDKYERLAARRRQNGELQKSLILIETGLRLSPAHSRLLALRDTVQAEIAGPLEKKRDQESKTGKSAWQGVKLKNRDAEKTDDVVPSEQ